MTNQEFKRLVGEALEVYRLNGTTFKMGEDRLGGYCEVMAPTAVRWCLRGSILRKAGESAGRTLTSELVVLVDDPWTQFVRFYKGAFSINPVDDNDMRANTYNGRLEIIDRVQHVLELM